ncbi:MAG: folate-binding protein YgfZ [Methylotenera sp.]|nr:MAG: folate-binding protein YgfZ [Methylotenera sp.]
MHLAEWHQFLRSTAEHPETMIVQDQKIMQFSDPITEGSALRHATVVCDLSHLGLLQLQGADSVTFLQGQVTNDVRLLDGTNAHYTGYCNPKGRLLALFLGFSHQGHLHLQFPRALVEPIMKRLKMFVMRSKVDIQDVSDSIIKMGLNGPQAPALLQKLFSELPQNDYDLVNLENGTLIKLPGLAPRYEILTSPDQAQAIWSMLKQGATPVGASAWDWLEIQAGIPEVNVQTQEAFVPQMLNLDALQAINYKKGCYTGQEIVARTHYLGKVKRRTQLAHISGETMPQLNDDVVDVNDQAVGKIVRVAPALGANADHQGFDCLVECRLENVGQDTVHWNHIPLTFKTLPYALEEG